MTLKSFCASLGEEVDALLRRDANLAPREDARAFGASIEQRIVDDWQAMCGRRGWAAEARPGRRTLFDVSCRVRGGLHGVDVKTSDLDEGRYADGGVCSVDNLLRFLAGRDAAKRGVLVVVEVAHKAAKGSARREVSSIVAAPLHQVAITDVRIENLGSGQVRLDRPLAELSATLDAERSVTDFLRDFVPLAQQHYARVAADAVRRREHLEAFARAGYSGFVSSRGAR